MKKIYSLICFCTPLFLTAQSNEGKVVYTETEKLEINIPEEHREQMKGVLPTSRTSIKELYFNATESIYKDAANQEDEVHEMGSESGGFHFKMKMERPDNQLYKNIGENKVYDRREFLGRDFLIIDEIEKFEWKLANEQKTILGYACQKALATLEDQIVEAWFAPEIPVPNGPLMYGQLPGMILELKVGEDDKHILATEVNLEALHKDDIQQPKKGKEVSREEYDKIVAEKTKEMEETHGGNRVIIHRATSNN